MAAWVPHTALQQRLTGQIPLESLVLRFQPPLEPQEAAERVARHLQREHGRKDFFIQTDDRLANAMQKPLTLCRF